MQYEIYIDVFFMINFVMDYTLILLLGKLQKTSSTKGRRILGALFGACSASLLICVEIPTVMELLILHVVINLLMIKIAISIPRKKLLQSWILLYIISFFMGGVLSWLQQLLKEYFRAGITFLFFVICGYYITLQIMDFLEQFWKINTNKKHVVLFDGTRNCEVQALVDTGNMLCDPITGRPVHIISNKAIKKFIEHNEEMKIRYIPYCTIADKESVIPILKIDKMNIQGKYEIEHPLLGISECEQFGNGTYEMILNPKDLQEE